MRTKSLATMGLFRRAPAHTDDITPTSSPSGHQDEKDGAISQLENASTADPSAKWKVSKTGDGDAAMALFNSPDEVHEPIDPAEEKRVVRKIDMMILPYLAVCYAFFYIDKTTLSYAAIFGIRDDLDLVGTKYSWLSSIVRIPMGRTLGTSKTLANPSTHRFQFYFGFLAWAL